MNRRLTHVAFVGALVVAFTSAVNYAQGSGDAAAVTPADVPTATATNTPEPSATATATNTPTATPTMTPVPDTRLLYLPLVSEE